MACSHNRKLCPMPGVDEQTGGSILASVADSVAPIIAQQAISTITNAAVRLAHTLWATKGMSDARRKRVLQQFVNLEVNKQRLIDQPLKDSAKKAVLLGAVKAVTVGKQKLTEAGRELRTAVSNAVDPLGGRDLGDLDGGNLIDRAFPGAAFERKYNMAGRS